jgi:glutamate-1-semialdehyde 2,1-aminomutase
MAAGIAQLTECLKPGFYEDLEKKTNSFVSALNEYAAHNRYNFRVFSIGSVFWFAFTDALYISSAEQIVPESMNYFKQLYKELLERGVYLGPSGYEVGFISEAHTPEILHGVQRVVMECLDSVMQ